MYKASIRKYRVICNHSHNRKYVLSFSHSSPLSHSHPHLANTSENSSNYKMMNTWFCENVLCIVLLVCFYKCIHNRTFTHNHKLSRWCSSNLCAPLSNETKNVLVFMRQLCAWLLPLSFGWMFIRNILLFIIFIMVEGICRAEQVYIKYTHTVHTLWPDNIQLNCVQKFQ